MPTSDDQPAHILNAATARLDKSEEPAEVTCDICGRTDRRIIALVRRYHLCYPEKSI